MTKERFFTDLDSIRLAYYNKHYYEDNKSWKEIADMLGTYPNRVRRDAKKLGVESRSKSDAQRIALSEGKVDHPTAGKKQSAETKLKISESQGKVWDEMSDEDREHRSKIGVESWNKKTEYDKTHFFKKSSEAMQEASKNGSKMEKYLFDFLIEEGYRVDKHKEHLLQNEKFHIDLYVHDSRTAIEIDGPMHFEPIRGEEKLQKRIAADTQKNGLILSADMVLIRVKLTKRDSQRQCRHVASSVLNIIKNVEKQFPNRNERYFEI